MTELTNLSRRFQIKRLNTGYTLYYQNSSDNITVTIYDLFKVTSIVYSLHGSYLL